MTVHVSPYSPRVEAMSARFTSALHVRWRGVWYWSPLLQLSLWWSCLAPSPCSFVRVTVVSAASAPCVSHVHPIHCARPQVETRVGILRGAVTGLPLREGDTSWSHVTRRCLVVSHRHGGELPGPECTSDSLN